MGARWGQRQADGTLRAVKLDERMVHDIECGNTGWDILWTLPA